LIFCYRVFGGFVTRGVQEHEKHNFLKVPSGLITKNVAFFPFLFFSLGCFSRGIFRVFGRFVTKGVQKRDNKNRGQIFAAAAAKKKLLIGVIFSFFFHGTPCFFASTPYTTLYLERAGAMCYR
jgi:hypothetical protein